MRHEQRRMSSVVPSQGQPASVPSRAEGRLGVIAGAGALPRLVAAAERRAGGEPHILALRGWAEDWVAGYDHQVIGVGQVGGIFAALKRAACRRVCFAGALSRPSLWGLRIDITGMIVAARVARLMRQGDDAMLRGFAGMFEERGFRLVGASELLTECLAPRGALTRRRPSRRDLSDAARAAQIIEQLGVVDVGQAAVVAIGRCLAVETVQGTDAMLAKLKGDRRRGGARIPSGVLVKAPKPTQDLRLDLPAIGPRTVTGVADAGLNGIIVPAGRVFLLEAEETLKAADAAGVFIYGSAADSAVLPTSG